jgi:hypothetical protein
MLAGASKTDITPEGPVWMDGMIRTRRSEGIHDRIHARALVLKDNTHTVAACAVVSVEVCGMTSELTDGIRRRVSDTTGIPYEGILIAATHTHSGPAVMGIFNPSEREYTDVLADRIVETVREAGNAAEPASFFCGAGRETTISHYRRLLADDGGVVMNWEPFPPRRILKPLGVPDTEVGVMKMTRESDPEHVLCILFNHAGHPNIMSGDNLLVSGDYPGVAMRELEKTVGGVALFLNGAQGSVDIDGHRDRDWEGVERAGTALAGAVMAAVRTAKPAVMSALLAESVVYTLPRRRITVEELAWAERILAESGGAVASMADGVGDDYRALLLKRLHGIEETPLTVEQTCIAAGEWALIGFPGELFTEIGMKLKLASPFRRTMVAGLANGEIGYVPTKRAVGEGGYAVSTRETGDDAESIVTARSLELLQRLYYR